MPNLTIRASAGFGIAAAAASACVIFIALSHFAGHKRRRREYKMTHLNYIQAALAMSKAEVLSLRRQLLCKAQSISYANTDPLMIMRGEGQYLYDQDGVAYLDTRNNVPHVG